MPKRKNIDDGESKYRIDYSDAGNFPNGMPRVTWDSRKMIDGINHIFYAGEYHPIWSDHVMIIEVYHLVLYHEYPDKESWYDHFSPIVMRSMSSYEATAQECYELARREQRELESYGEFVPIFLND